MPDIQLYRQIVQFRGDRPDLGAHSDLKKQCEELETELAERKAPNAGRKPKTSGQKKPNARRGWILNAWLLESGQLRRLLRDLPSDHTLREFGCGCAAPSAMRRFNLFQSNACFLTA